MSKNEQASYLGVDMGGGTIKFGLVSEEGKIVSKHAVETDQDRGPEICCRELGKEIKRTLGDRNLPVGVGLPGLMDCETGRIRRFPNFPGWDGYPLRDSLIESSGCPQVFLENDANAGALGEFWVGAGKEKQSVLVAALGTGIGGGIILDGRIWRGGNGLAGELGHVKVYDNGPQCGCGSLGCVETFAGGFYIADRGREAVQQGSISLDELGVGMINEVTQETLAAAAKNNHKAAREIFTESGRALGKALAQALMIMDLDFIIIIGGGSNSLPLMEKALRAEMEKNLFGRDVSAIAIRKGALGVDAGIIGAAYLAREGSAQTME